MKKILAIVLALALVMSSFTAAFANTTIGAEAQACADLAMLKGEGNGVTPEYLAKTPTRIQAAILFLRLKGLEADALKFEGKENFADAVGVKSEGNKAVMAYLKAHPEYGWTGVGNNNFAPEREITAKEYYKVMLEALGYKQNSTTVVGQFDFANVLEFAASKGLSKIATAAKITNNEIAVATIETLKATVKDSTKTLAASLIDAKVINEDAAVKAGIYAKPVLVVAKAVASVTNTKLKVTLEAAQDLVANNIAIVDKAGKAVAVKSVAQTADKKIAYATTDAMVAGEIYTVTINGKAFTMVAKPATDTKLQVSTAGANNSVEVKVTFSVDVDPTTALVAANYAIDNSLTVTAVKAGDTANEVVLTTSEQVAGKLYKVTVTNVIAENGNGLKTDANTAYFGGKAKDDVKPTATVAAGTNTRFKVTFTDSSSLDAVSVLNPANYVIDGLKVLAVAYDINPSTGKEIKNVVVVTTEAQTAGKLYTVVVNNVADVFGNVIKADTKLYFGGVAKDEVKPTATAQSVSNKSVKVTFADNSDINAATATNIANYVIEGLAVTAAELDGKDVTLTTAAQEAGKLYTITINNVTDEYGNAIKADTKVYFGGKAVDSSAPTYTALATSNTKVRITFSDSIDKNTVKPENFFVKDLGYAVAAKLDTTYDSTGKTVEITTLAQASGKVYTLEVRNVTNTDATAVKTDSKTTFAGMSTVTLVAPRLLAAIPVDSKTITLTFDQNLSVLPSQVNVTVGTTTENITSGISFKGTSKTEVTVLLGSTTLVEGTLYKAEAIGAIGANAIALDTNYDEVQFAGVTIAQTGAKVLAVTTIDNNTVKVYFDKAVNFASADKGTIALYAQNKTTAINYDTTSTAVTAQTVSMSTDKKEMTVSFRHATNTLTLVEGTIYTVKFTDLTKVKTVTGALNLIPEVDGASVANVQFGAVATAAVGPELLAVIPVSKYVVQMTFNKAVQEVGTVKNALTIEGTNMPLVTLVEIDEDDATKVRLYLDETGKTAFTEGTIYRVIYTPAGGNAFADELDATLLAKVDASGTYAGKATAQFGALNNVAEGPAVTAITNVNANTVKVTLDQAITGLAASANVVVKEGTSTIPTTDYSVIVASDAKSFRIVRTNGIFKAGTTYSVALTTAVKDVSGLRAADATVVTSFGGNGNVDLVLVGTASSGAVNATLKNSTNADVNGKVLRLRVLTNLGTATTVTTAEVTTATGAAAWTIANDAAGEVYVLEATDGSVAITVIR